MTLLEQLRGNFPKTIDKNKPLFSSIVANDKGTGAIQKQLTDLFKYMKEWISTPDIYKQTGVMLDKTVTFFSFLERFADETETSLKNRFAAIFIRNHDNKWGTVFDVKSVFKQYFPHARIFLVENTNKIDDSSPEYANLFVDGDINSGTPTAWDLVDCSATAEARFSKGFGIELDQADGYFEQTVTILNRKRITEEEPYEYKRLTYYLHFFLSGKVNVKIYNSANSKYWDDANKEWSSTEVQNPFEKSEWEDCSLYFITEGDDDTTDITVTFSYVGTPVESELENTVFNGQLPVTWTLTDCTETDNVITLNQEGAKVETTETIMPENSYDLKFSSKGKVNITIKSDNNKYWDFDNQVWKISSTYKTFNSVDWIDRSLTFIPESEDSDVTITFDYSGYTAYLRDIKLEGNLITTETLTDCTEEYGVIHMEQMSSVASYNTNVKANSIYNFSCKFAGRTGIVVQNDNNEYWDIASQKWSSTIIKNECFLNDNQEYDFTIKADSDTTELTISFGIPNTYTDYFRLFEKQPFASFTVMAHFEGNTSMGVFGLAEGDADPNMETEEETPPQPRYRNYGYYDKSFLSGVPIGFASDIYEDLLDYLRAQGVKAYLEIVIRDYSGIE